jgi:hypothetical protein
MQLSARKIGDKSAPMCLTHVCGLTLKMIFGAISRKALQLMCLNIKMIDVDNSR